MTVRITGIKTTVQNPKKLNYDELSEDDFYKYKLTQPLTLLSKAVALISFIKQENSQIEDFMRNNVPVEVQNGVSSASIVINGIDNTKLSSLEFSLLLMQFTYVEALTNIIGECALRSNVKTKVLNSVEEDFLKEIESKYKDGKIVTKQSFIRTESKVKEYIKLYAKSNNETYLLDTANQSWVGFIKAKEIRNEITHPKNGVGSNIELVHLFEMSRFIYWYTEEAYKIFEKHTSTRYYHMIESWSYGMLYHLFEIQKNPKSKIDSETAKHNKLKTANSQSKQI